MATNRMFGGMVVFLVPNGVQARRLQVGHCKQALHFVVFDFEIGVSEADMEAET